MLGKLKDKFGVELKNNPSVLIAECQAVPCDRLKSLATIAVICLSYLPKEKLKFMPTPFRQDWRQHINEILTMENADYEISIALILDKCITTLQDEADLEQVLQEAKDNL